MTTGTVSSAAERYADALFDLGVAENVEALQTIESDMKALSSAIAESADLKSFLRSPVYSAEEKSGAILAISDKAGFSGLTRNFLALVAQNRRLFALEEMLTAFFAKMSEHRGEVSAEAISAAPLNEDQTKRLRGEIEHYVGKAGEP